MDPEEIEQSAPPKLFGAKVAGMPAKEPSKSSVKEDENKEEEKENKLFWNAYNGETSPTLHLQ